MYNASIDLDPGASQVRAKQVLTRDKAACANKPLYLLSLDTRQYRAVRLLHVVLDLFSEPNATMRPSASPMHETR